MTDEWTRYLKPRSKGICLFRSSAAAAAAAVAAAAVAVTARAASGTATAAVVTAALHQPAEDSDRLGRFPSLRSPRGVVLYDHGALGRQVPRNCHLVAGRRIQGAQLKRLPVLSPTHAGKCSSSVCR